MSATRRIGSRKRRATKQFELGRHTTGFWLPGTAGRTSSAASVHFAEALRFFTAEAAPVDYALTQHNLGLAYAALLTGDRAANLARAIGCYTEALRFRTPEAAPRNYAATQNNLGLAYAGFPTGDRAANLARAIGCYREALRFRTAEAAPGTVRRDPAQPGCQPTGRFRAGIGGQPGPRHRLLPRGAALLHRGGRPA